MNRRYAIVALLVLFAATAAAALVTLGIMFPSVDDLRWPAMPEADRRHESKSVEAVFRFVDHAAELRFVGDHRPALEEVRRYRYLRDSPYTPGDRISRERVFSVGTGKVLVEADLSEVRHSGAPYEGRYALHLPSGTAVSADVDLPEGAILSTEVAVLPSFGEASTCGAELDVEIVGRGGAPRSHRFRYDREDDGSDFGWKLLQLEIGAGGPTTIAIHSRAVEGCEGHAQLFLADPVIHAPSTRAPPTNVLYINICTWRADDMGALGSGRDSTPVLDRLAERSVLFTRARTNSNWSKASQMSAILGRYPSTFGVKHYRVPVSRFERESYAGLALDGLASVLRGRGYDTVALVNNVFFSDYLKVGVDLGFARYLDSSRHIHNTADLAAEGVRWLERHGDRPFLMYVNLANAHHAYRPPREYLGQVGFGLGDLLGDTQRALHLGEVAYSDAAAGVLLTALERLGLDERTLVVVHSDHGEILSDSRNLEVTVRNTVRPRVVSRYGPTRYKHGYSWYDAEVRVPLMLSHRGRLPEGRRVDEDVSIIDLAPTVLRLVGEPVPVTMHGSDLLDGSRGTRPTIIEGKQFRAVVSGGFKYVRFVPGLEEWRRSRDVRSTEKPELLYDLGADPEERRDLSGDPASAGTLEKMRRLLDRKLPRAGALHELTLQGPTGSRFLGTVELGGAPATATLSGHGPGDRLERTENGLSFEIAASPPGYSPPVIAFSGSTPLEEITLAVMADGRPLPEGDLRLGPHGLPLATERMESGRVTLDAGLIGALGISPGQEPRFEEAAAPLVRWWSRSIANGGPEGFTAESMDENVMDAMKDWGYAQ